MTSSIALSAGPGRVQVLRSVAWLEARRMLRSPWLLLGALATTVLVRDYTAPPGWHGAQYLMGFFPAAALQAVTAILVAISFHSARSDLSAAAPVDEAQRCIARLLAALLPFSLIVAAVIGLTAYIWSTGGLDLGDEPGRTLHAHPTAGEILQPIAAGMFAVATGAAAGRRMHFLATSILTLLVGWYVVTTFYWLFQAAAVAPFAIVQAQPVYVDLGPGVDPHTLPHTWLLAAPEEGTPRWSRLVVSEPLAWWHNGWLLGLTLLGLALAFPAPWRRRMALAGGILAATCLIAQFVVYPS